MSRKKHVLSENTFSVSINVNTFDFLSMPELEQGTNAQRMGKILSVLVF